MRRLKRAEVISSPVSGRTYRVQGPLGEGGFGRAYLALELDRRGKELAKVCLKTTSDQESWHRESYFGELLRGHRRVIQTLDSFPLASRSRARRMLFCLVLELAESGTVADYLEKTHRPWSEARATREIKALLKVLEQLHGASATHRDLTPMNIFVRRNGTLKLGDFGIARHQLARASMNIDAFNPDFVTKGFRDSQHRHWLAVDDVYQMGQLLVALISGNPDRAIRPNAVKDLACSARLRRVIRRAIGQRGRRYADAHEMLQALEGEDASVEPHLRSLAGKKVAFTGPLSIGRFDAEVLVFAAGGEVVPRITRSVDVVVQGGRSARHTGSKLAHAKRLIKQGYGLTIIGEAEFRRLVRPLR